MISSNYDYLPRSDREGFVAIGYLPYSSRGLPQNQFCCSAGQISSASNAPAIRVILPRELQQSIDRRSASSADDGRIVD